MSSAAPALSARQRLEFRAARALSNLPPRVQVRLSGRPPIEVDGQRLEPDWQVALAMLERQGAVPIEDLPPAQAREVLRQQAQVAAGPLLPVGAVRDLEVPGPEGPLRARHYAPSGEEPAGPAPLIVFFHGGGFVLGDLDSHEAPCRVLCRHVGAHVLSVDYRLAPEHPFPAPGQDAVAAFAWATEHAGELGADPGRLAVAGDSAGANLAAHVAWERTHAGERAPDLQVLLYPGLDRDEAHASRELFGEGFLLTRKQMAWFVEQYLPDDTPEHPWQQPLACDVAGLPPALVVTAGFDPLRDEGEKYAARLAEAGVDVLLRRFPGQIHGFINAIGVSRSARDATLEVAGMTRALLR